MRFLAVIPIIFALSACQPPKSSEELAAEKEVAHIEQTRREDRWKLDCLNTYKKDGEPHLISLDGPLLVLGESLEDIEERLQRPEVITCVNIKQADYNAERFNEVMDAIPERDLYDPSVPYDPENLDGIPKPEKFEPPKMPAEGFEPKFPIK